MMIELKSPHGCSIITLGPLTQVASAAVSRVMSYMVWWQNETDGVSVYQYKTGTGHVFDESLAIVDETTIRP